MAPQILTIQTLSDRATPYLKQRAQTEFYQNAFLVAGVTFVFAAVIVAITPLIKSSFSGVIQYDTATIASASATGGIGILSLLASMQRKYAAGKIEMPQEVIQYRQKMEQFYTVYDPSHVFGAAYVSALNLNWQEKSLKNMGKEEFKQLLLSQYLQRFDLISGNFVAPEGFHFMKTNPHKQEALNELNQILDPRFIALFDYKSE